MIAAFVSQFYRTLRRCLGRNGGKSFDVSIGIILEQSASALDRAGTGAQPYDVIRNLADAYVHAGTRIYDAALSCHAPGIACASGCAHCCHLNSTVQTGNKSNAVGMTLLDGVVLLEHLVGIRHSPAAGKVLANVNRIWRGLPGSLDRFLCPFDLNGQCAVYAARPMVCRLYFSNNATHCAVQADIPANERQFDTPIAKTLRPIRHALAGSAKRALNAHLPDAAFGYFDFMTVAHTIVNAVMDGQEAALRSAINTRQSF